MIGELSAVIGQNEKILYQGKPDKKCYIFESIFNPLLPLEVLSLILGFEVLVGIIFVKGFTDLFSTAIIGMLICSIPGFMYLACILLINKQYKNSEYIITDKAIYVSSGIFTHNIKTKPFAELSHIDLHRGIFDQLFKVGDIIATTNQLSENKSSATIIISNVSNYIEIYNLVKKLQTDIYTDVMYPNDKRPAENHGYKTQYKG